MLMPKRTKFRKQHRGRMTGTETRGVSLHFGEFGLQAVDPCWMTIRQIEAELGIPIDKRRFRANVYLNLASDYARARGFAEDELVGRKLRIGSGAEIMVLERDPRCMMISLDPDTGEHNPEVLRKVARAHDTFAGVYCAVLVEGIMMKNDSIELLD